MRSLLVFAPHSEKKRPELGPAASNGALDVSGGSGGHTLVCHHLGMPTPGSKRWLRWSSFKVSPPRGTVRQPFS